MALCSYCKYCYLFNILYRCFIFTYLDTVQLAESCKIHIDLNPLDACIAEKQRSDKKLSIIENKAELNHEVATEKSEEQCRVAVSLPHFKL